MAAAVLSLATDVESLRPALSGPVAAALVAVFLAAALGLAATTARHCTGDTGFALSFTPAMLPPPG